MRPHFHLRLAIPGLLAALLFCGCRSFEPERARREHTESFTRTSRPSPPPNFPNRSRSTTASASP